MQRRGRLRANDGASAVELAIVLPLLLMLVFGIMYFGFVFAQEIALNNGARQAARSGVVADAECGDIITMAQNASATIGMGSGDVTVTVTRENSSGATVLASCSGATVACEDSDPGDVVRVVAQKSTAGQAIDIPFGPSLADQPEGVGVFRCEFS